MNKTRGLFVFLAVVSSFLLPFGDAGAQEEAEFWSMFVNNSWNYRGVDSSGFTWTWADRIARTDSSTFPVTTYVSEGRQGGSLRVTEWYSIGPTEIRFWRRDFLDNGSWLSATVTGGFLWGKVPVVVGDHWGEVKSGSLSGNPITVTTDVTILGQETITVDAGTYTAYKTRHIITTSGFGIYDSTTEYYWFVPYLGKVRWEGAGTPYEWQYLTGHSSYPWRFRDVSPSSFAHSQIESVAAAGITGGCSTTPPLYCPESTITRGQMAVFVEAALSHPPNVCTGRFSDVPIGNPFCGYVERMADDGITGGCGTGIFCPNAPVTRGQMAVFIETALGHSPNTCTGQFTDVPVGHSFCKFVEHLASDGITSGCGPGTYCPDAPVTRAQMAVFLVAAPAPLSP